MVGLLPCYLSKTILSDIDPIEEYFGCQYLDSLDQTWRLWKRERMQDRRKVYHWVYLEERGALILSL